MNTLKIERTSPEAHSTDLVAGNIAQLKALFPELVSEGANGATVNLEVLKVLVGDATAMDTDEKYGMNWHGKRRARQLALTPSAGTLRPYSEESVDWDSTQHLMIEGDNLEVLKQLQKSYSGKVKLIYIDPPYNTGSDFVYPDDYQDTIRNYLSITRQVGDGQRISSNTESGGRFHTSWLNMMYPRLSLARNLLSEDGSIFISIDDGELPNLLAVMNELFGEDNFRANVSWQKRYTRSNNTVDFTTMVEHLVVYSKSDLFAVNLLERTKEADARYTNPDNDPRGAWKGASILNPATPQQRPGLCYPIINPNTSQITYPTKNAWRRSKSEFDKLAAEGRLYWGADGKQALPSIKMFLTEARDITPVNFWDHSFAGNTDDGTRDLRELLGEKVFDNPKPVQLVRRVLEHGSNKDSIVLDFFGGSGTTGQAVLEQNISDGGTRKFILVQLPEPLDPNDKSQAVAAKFCENIRKPLTIAEITKERIRRVGERLRVNNGLLNPDLGFRVFKLDESCIARWSADASKLEETLLSNLQHIIPGRTEIDLLYEVSLKLGLDLCVPVEKWRVHSKSCYAVGGGVLFMCFEPKISHAETELLAQALIQWKEDLQPIVEPICIFLDSAFDSDIAKLNLVAILEQNGMGSIRTI